MIVGQGKWDVEKVKAGIRKAIAEGGLKTLDEIEDMGGYELQTLVSGAWGCNQPEPLLEIFNIVGEDPHGEFTWEEIERVAASDADAIMAALVLDETFCDELDKLHPGEGWTLWFGPRETDGDFCFWFSF